jgi:TonB family protein
MRKYLISILLISLAINLKGQIVDTLYYNTNWQLVALGSGDFYRVAKIDTSRMVFVGEVKDYLHSGELVLEGFYDKNGLKEGEFKRYYNNEKIYSVGEYRQGRLGGVWSYFDEDGSLYEKVVFNDTDFYIEDYFDKNGNHLVENGTGKWEKVFRDRLGYLILTAFFENGERVNIWTVKDETGEIVVKEIYKEGRMKKGIATGNPSKRYNESKFRHNLFYPGSFENVEGFKVGACTKVDYPYIAGLPGKPYEAIFQIVEKNATYPGGVPAFYNTLQKTMTYPVQAQRMGLEGKVFVEFVIDEEGNITDVQVLRGIGGGCDEEAVRVIKNSGKWIPGEQRGQKVRQRMVLPITFSLN